MSLSRLLLCLGQVKYFVTRFWWCWQLVYKISPLLAEFGERIARECQEEPDPQVVRRSPRKNLNKDPKPSPGDKRRRFDAKEYSEKGG